MTFYYKMQHSSFHWKTYLHQNNATAILLYKRLTWRVFHNGKYAINSDVLTNIHTFTFANFTSSVIQFKSIFTIHHAHNLRAFIAFTNVTIVVVFLVAVFAFQLTHYGWTCIAFTNVTVVVIFRETIFTLLCTQDGWTIRFRWYTQLLTFFKGMKVVGIVISTSSPHEFLALLVCYVI